MQSPRSAFAYAALLAATFVAACGDATTPRLDNAPSAVTATAALQLNLGQYIDQQIPLLFDKGFANSVAARWATVKRKKATNFALAAKDFAQLADWIDKKASSVTPAAGETREQGAVRLVLNMSRWLYGDDSTPIVGDVGGDVTLEVVPAGEPATIVVPSEHAGVDFGPQAEDRVIIISQEEYPGICNGPLLTPRCQYPLFYRFESFPHTKLIGHGRFAVCLVTTGERRPLDYPSDETNGEVHQRIRLAHDLPANPADYTDGATQEDGIEILPLAAAQKGFVHCGQETHLGMGPMEKAAHAVMHFAARVISPKSLYAYDQGPEHLSDAFSSFNAVDPAGQPDVSVASLSAPPEAFGGDAVSVTYTVANTSRRSNGEATAASTATAAQLYLFDSEGSPVAALGAPDAVGAMRPDAPAQTFPHSVTLPTDISLDQSYRIGVTVGTAGVHGEVGLENNTQSAEILVKKKKADLVFATPFTLSSSEVIAGNPVTTSAWSVKNTGNAASGPFAAQFYLVKDGVATAVGSAISYESIAPDATVSSTAVTLTIGSAVPPGTYDVVLKLDPANTVEEFDDANNAASASLTVQVSAGAIAGVVRNAFNNAAISGAVVTAGSVTTETAPNGAFTLTGLPPGTYTVVGSAPGFTSQSRGGVNVTGGATTTIDPLLLAPVASTTDIRIVLDWGAAPRDLDSHLSGPTASGGRFHVYWAATSFSDAASAASLDRDDVTSFGPETITLTRQSAGTYNYLVHNWSQETTLGGSGATVRIFRGSALLGSFTAPTGSGTCWKVFSLSGETISTVNQLVNCNYAIANLVIGTTASSTSSDDDLDMIIADIIRAGIKPTP